jgi:hypothetical protein
MAGAGVIGVVGLWSEDQRPMIDLLNQGQAWLASQLAMFVARNVIYRHGSVEIPVRATIGRTAFEQADETGAIIRFESRDFLIDRTSLVADGQIIEPSEGDIIVDVIGDITYEFELFGAGPDAMYRPSDPYHHKLRIHTKRVRELP